MTGFKEPPLATFDGQIDGSDVYAFINPGQSEINTTHIDSFDFSMTGTATDEYGRYDDDLDDDFYDRVDHSGVYFESGIANAFGDNYQDASETSLDPSDPGPVIHYGLHTDWGLG